MSWLLLGLALFLGSHAVRLVADDWRTRQVARLGLGPWMGLTALVALAGLVLIVHGYATARAAPVVVWSPPVWTRHAAGLLTLPAFVLLAAAYVPGSRLRARVGHPMVLGIVLWAAGHLLANGTLADLVLFGAFLGWAAASFVAGRRRDRAAGTAPGVGPAWRDAVVVGIGLLAWAAFAFWLHAALLGVRPFG